MVEREETGAAEAFDEDADYEDVEYEDDEFDEGDEYFEKAPIERFHQSAVGSVFAAGMLGLRDALEGPPKEQVVYEQAAAGEPHTPDLILRLDPDHPEDSIVMVRRRDDSGENPAEPTE